jgi:hypothetical protein
MILGQCQSRGLKALNNTYTYIYININSVAFSPLTNYIDRGGRRL